MEDPRRRKGLAEEPDPAADAPHGGRVVLASSDAAFRLIARASLRPLGLELVDAAQCDGRDWGEPRPALLIVDAAGAGALCKRARRAEAGAPAMPFIAVTPGDRPDLVPRLFALGARDVLRKPVPGRSWRVACGRCCGSTRSRAASGSAPASSRHSSA